MLLLNCSLTTTVGRSNDRTHMSLWQPFVEFVIEELSKHRDSLGIIALGSHARQYKPIIVKNTTNEFFECEHPSVINYVKRPWEHNDVFANLTKFHNNHNNIKIDW